MTEAEWLDCTDPRKMVQRLRARAGGRKDRLFLCACYRRSMSQLSDDTGMQAVEVSERFVDGAVGREELDAAWAAVRIGLPFRSAWTAYAIWSGWRGLAAVGAWDARRLPRRGFFGRLRWNEARELQAHSDFLRDLFGNPFRPFILDPAWLAWNSGTAPKLAAAINEERAFDRLPVLADALEDAGCTDVAILEHCRSGGEHVRGCWVVDLLLGKK